jgi:hypothetical protein
MKPGSGRLPASHMLGGLVEARLRLVDQPAIKDYRIWGVHEPMSVKRLRAMPNDCPRCGLVNPPKAQRCDCGYDFVTRRMKRSYLVRRQFHKAAGIGVTGTLFIFVLIRVLVQIFSDLLSK